LSIFSEVRFVTLSLLSLSLPLPPSLPLRYSHCSKLLDVTSSLAHTHSSKKGVGFRKFGKCGEREEEGRGGGFYQKPA
jgi:hypothetical protein